jgi:streptomycin 6-kinase
LTPDTYLDRWRLAADGAPVETPSSLLLPVRRNGAPTMLKIAREEEERRGGRLMAWWDGHGAARVLAHDDNALLLERAMGPRSLAAMAAASQDDEASRILCAVAARLHAPRPSPPPELVPLSIWFEALAPAANALGGALAQAGAMARKLLAAPQDIVVLHGDIHHGNVLDAGERGWVAIDPKAGVPLSYHNGFIQVATDEQIEKQVAKPFWGAIADPKWENVSKDMSEALDRRDNGAGYAAWFACKALESAIKITSDLKNWTTGNEKGAHNYIDNLVAERDGARFIDKFEMEVLKSYFTHVRRQFGHGPGSDPMPNFTVAQTDWAIEFAMTWVRTLVRRL